MPESFLLGRQRISAGLSQDFVKRYRSSAVISVIFIIVIAVAVESLDEAIRFFHLLKRRKEK